MWASFEFARGLYDDGLYEEAIMEFEKVVAESPTSSEAQHALLLIGNSYTNRENYEQAELAYARLWDGYPSGIYASRALYNLAESQFLQAKYKRAVDNFLLLLERFPRSEQATSALEYIVRSYYELEDYNQVIISGKRLVRDYQNAGTLPDVLLWMAKAYFANNIPSDGKATLNTIISEHQGSNAYWQAIELQIEQQKQDDGIEAAISTLEEILAKQVPRQFEERLSYLLVQFYLETGVYTEALQRLRMMVQKFDHSEDLDEYLTLLKRCEIEIGFYEEVTSDLEKYARVMQDSPWHDEYYYYVALAWFRLGSYDESQQLIENLLEQTEDNELRFEGRMLLAQIKEERNLLRAAITDYQALIGSPYARDEELLLKIGNIYYEKLNNYQMAKNFYQQIFLQHAELDFQHKAAYQLALCNEKLGHYEEAIADLQRVSVDTVKDEELKDNIIAKHNYLQKFKVQEHDKAFSDLLGSLFGFFEQEDKDQIRHDIVSIYINRLKEYDKALELIGDPATDHQRYQKALVHLRLAEKNQLEGMENVADNHLVSVSSLISQIETDNYHDELLIRNRLQYEKEMTAEIASNMNDFVRNYPDHHAKNEFLYLLSQYHKNNEQPEIAIDYSKQITDKRGLDEFSYYNTMIEVAEYYYGLDEDEEALEYYQRAADYITLSNPLIYFHFAVVLYETGNTAEGLERLTFLVNNLDDFDGYELAINYLTGILRQNGEYERALHYQLQIPQERRNDAFYKQLADDYITLGNKEKAKEALMHIVEKDYETLKQLGRLQYETGDFTMAQYTLSQLLDQRPDDTENIERLANVEYELDNYTEALKHFNAVLDGLGNEFEEHPDIEELVTRTIITLYEVGNRPQAESQTRKYRKVLSERAEDKIALHEAIYYQPIDSRRAERIFDRLIKDASQEIRMQAYFWRGVLYIENEKPDDAISDFIEVLQLGDEEYINQAHLKLGTLQFSKENYQAALDHYYHVIENDTEGELALNAAKNFAIVCKTIEEWQKAIAAYELILDRWGDSDIEAETIFDIAYCHYRDRQYQNAVSMFQQALTMLDDKETKAEAQYWIGESYYGMSEYEVAVTEFLKVSYAYPEFAHWSASAELRAGEAYIQNREFDKARRILERIVEKYGRDSNWGQQALQRLAEIG
jgi:tetratricopeptide (TPR) repeat protein